MAGIGTSPVNQAVATYSAGTSIAITITAPTNNNALVCCYEGADASVGISSFTQTGTVAWALAIAQSTGRRAEIHRALNVQSAGIALTANLSGTPSPSAAGISISEWSDGNGTVNWTDNVGTGSTATTTNPLSASVTPTANRDSLGIAICRSGSGAVTATGGGFTALTNIDGATARGTPAYIVGTTSGSYQCTWTNSTSATYGTAVVFFLGAAQGGGADPFQGRATASLAMHGRVIA